MANLLPDCMALVGPSDPCKGFTRLQTEHDQLRDYLISMHSKLGDAAGAVAQLRQQLGRNRPTITLTREDAVALLAALQWRAP